jgi:hypothetical protein
MAKLKLISATGSTGPSLHEVNFRLMQLHARLSCAAHVLDSEVINGIVGAEQSQRVVLAAVLINELDADFEGLATDLDKAIVGVASKKNHGTPVTGRDIAALNAYRDKIEDTTR